MTRPTIVYVSGPITTGGNVPVNVRKGIEAAVELMDLGYVVICPHEKAFGMEMLSPRSYDAWMDYDYSCIRASDAVYRMPAPSRGGDLEVAYAEKIGTPVFFDVDTLRTVLPPLIDSAIGPRHRVLDTGIDLAAQRLRAVAETGMHSLTFGHPALEAAAQAILKLHRRVLG